MNDRTTLVASAPYCLSPSNSLIAELDRAARELFTRCLDPVRALVSGDLERGLALGLDLDLSPAVADRVADELATLELSERRQLMNNLVHMVERERDHKGPCAQLRRRLLQTTGVRPLLSPRVPEPSPLYALASHEPLEALGKLSHLGSDALAQESAALRRCAKHHTEAVLTLISARWRSREAGLVEVLARCAKREPGKTLQVVAQLVDEGCLDAGDAQFVAERIVRKASELAAEVLGLVGDELRPGLAARLAKAGKFDELLTLLDPIGDLRPFEKSLARCVRAGRGPQVSPLVKRSIRSAQDLRRWASALVRLIEDGLELDLIGLVVELEARAEHDPWERAQLNQAVFGLRHQVTRKLSKRLARAATVPVDTLARIEGWLRENVLQLSVRHLLPEQRERVLEPLRALLTKLRLAELRMFRHLVKKLGLLHPDLRAFVGGRSQQLDFPKTGSRLRLVAPLGILVHQLRPSPADIWRALACEPGACVPVAPILRWRARGDRVQVISRFCGSTIGDALRAFGLAPGHSDQLDLIAESERDDPLSVALRGLAAQVTAIHAGLRSRDIDHGHAHLENFTVEFVRRDALDSWLAGGGTVNTLPYDSDSFSFDLDLLLDDHHEPIVRIIDMDAARRVQGRTTPRG